MADFDSDSQDEKLLQEAEELMRQKRFQDAASRYQDLRRTSPTDLWASLGYASALECAGKITEAEQILEEATLRHKRSAPLHRFRHMFFERREDIRASATSQAVLHAEPLEEGPEDQLADLYFNQGRYHEALAELERLLRDGELGEDELRASVLARTGACLRQNGDHDVARDRLLEALDLDPGHHWILSELAESERAMGNAAEARSRYREALAANPDDHWCRGHLAQLEAEEGNADEAVKLYREILTQQPKTAWAKVELAQVLTDKDASESAVLCASALDDDPTYPWAHAQLGNLARRSGKLEVARDHFRQALEGAPDAPWVLHELADICRHLGRMEEAYAHLERARAMDPYDATTYGYFADLLRHEGKTGPAIANLEKAVELDPEYAWAWRELAELRALGGKPEEAETAYRKAVELEPDEAINDGLRAFLLRCQGKRDAALPWLERAVERQKDYLWAWREQIDYHLARGKPADAEGAARRGIEQMPESTPLLGLLAESLRRQGRHREAREPVLRALTLSPDTPQLHALHAEILAEDGEAEAAVPCARRATELDDAPEYRALLAQVLIAAGHADEGAEIARALASAKEPIQPAYELAALVAERGDDLAGAIRWCDKGLAAHPTEPRLIVRRARLGQQAQETNATDRLVPLFDVAGQLPWRDISQLFAQAGRAVLARRAAYLVISGAEGDGEARAERRAKAWLHLAELELNLANPAEATQALGIALGHDADCVPARILGAVLADQRGDLPAAIGHLEHLDRRLHDRDGSDEPAESSLLLRQLASLHERTGDHGQAGRCWDRIRAEVGDDPTYRADHAAFRLRHGEAGAVTEAEAVLAALPATLPEGQRLLRELAIARANQSGAEAALAVLRPRLADLGTANRLLFAQLALGAGEPALAREQAERVAEAEPGNRAARLLRCRALLASRDLVGAEIAARAVVGQAPDDEEAALLLGEALAMLGRHGDALTVLDRRTLPARPSFERGLLTALVRFEALGEAAGLAALGRAPTPARPTPIARVLAAAYPEAWASEDPDHRAAPDDLLALPPFPAMARIIASALAARGRDELATNLLLGVAAAVAGRQPAVARDLRLRALPALRRLGHYTLALRLAWQARAPLALLRALLP